MPFQWAPNGFLTLCDVFFSTPALGRGSLTFAAAQRVGGIQVASLGNAGIALGAGDKSFTETLARDQVTGLIQGS